MIKGTSQSFKFKLPCDYSDILTLIIIFWQEDYQGISSNRPLPIMKNLEQCITDDVSNNEIYVILSPEETLRFTEEKKGHVQIIVKSLEGNTYGSKDTLFTVYPVYGNQTADDIELPPSIDGFIILDGEQIIT